MRHDDAYEGVGQASDGVAIATRHSQPVAYVQVGQKRLSPGAYENNLAASRRWKREHAEQNDKHNWATCECGNRMRHRAETCGECRKAGSELRAEMALQMRAEGLYNDEIAKRLGTSPAAVAVLFNRLRRDGRDVPPAPYWSRGAA